MKENTFYVRPYTVDWNNEESDSLHLEYSYNGDEWYALNGSNGVLFPQIGSKRMKNPKFVRNSEGSITLYAQDALDENLIFLYSTKDLIKYSDEQLVEKSSISDVNLDDNSILEISKDELTALQAIWGKPEPVVITEVESVEIEANVGDDVELPTKVSVTYSNGSVEKLPVTWETSLDSSKAGTFEIKGTVSEHQYTNPLIYHRADPFIYKHTDGYYYFTASYTDMEHNLDGIYQYIKILLRRAATLEGLGDGSGEYTEVTVFERAPLHGKESPHIWAPEVHFVQGKWYIYYTTSINEDDLWSIRPHALECADADPMTGTWVNKGPIAKTVDDGFAMTDFSLDHTVLQHNGELYMFWAEKHPILSDIYAAKMVNPWTIESSRVTKITGPEYNWELHGFPVCEGPSFLHRNGKIFLIYSASGTDALYCNGMLTADENADLLDPASWSKSPFPVLQSSRATGQFGVGHNSFTVDEYGNDVIVYHARQEERYLVDEGYQPLYDAGRNTSIMKIYWNPDGTPNFSVPIPSGKGKDIFTDVRGTVTFR